MKRLNKTKSPDFILVCALRFAKATFYFYWPARESRRSLNIALDFYVWRCSISPEAKFGKCEYDL